MLIATKIVNWVMLVIGILGILGLASDPSLDPDGWGMLISMIWVGQSILNLVFASHKQKGEV